MKQTKILHTQEALIVRSITQRTETIKMCDRLHKKTRIRFYPRTPFTIAICISQIDPLVFKLTTDKNMIWA